MRSDKLARHFGRLGLMAALLGAASSPALAAHFECPKKGGHLIFAGEAKLNSLDMMASNTISTRNVAMNIYESLMTRDEANAPILDFGASRARPEDNLITP